MQAGRARNIAIAVVFHLGLRPPPPLIRRLHRLPEHADLLFELTVSPCPFPLSLRARPRPLTTLAVGADRSSPPAMTQTVLEPP